MTTKIDIFRAINARNPDIVERLINLWGRPELHEYVIGLLNVKPGTSGPALPPDVRVSLTSVIEVHGEEFPHLAQPTTGEVGSENLLDNAQLQAIDAKFPRIARQLSSLWGQAGFGPYIDGLLNDKRLGRQGFPADIASALMALSLEHDREYPQFVVKVSDIWILDNKIF